MRPLMRHSLCIIGPLCLYLIWPLVSASFGLSLPHSVSSQKRLVSLFTKEAKIKRPLHFGLFILACLFVMKHLLMVMMRPHERGKKRPIGFFMKQAERGTQKEAKRGPNLVSFCVPLSALFLLASFLPASASLGPVPLCLIWPRFASFDLSVPHWASLSLPHWASSSLPLWASLCFI